MSDAQWSLIAGLLPARTGRPCRLFADARLMVVEGIIYRYRCGIAWRDLPEVFGPWQTVWTWHSRLVREGAWDRVLVVLTSVADAAVMVDPSLSVDSTIARAHQRATNGTRRTGVGSNSRDRGVEPPDRTVGRSRGGLTTKMHQLVDGHGLPLMVLLTPGQAGDAPMFEPLMARLK